MQRKTWQTADWEMDLCKIKIYTFNPMELMRRPIFNIQTQIGNLSHLNHMKWRLLCKFSPKYHKHQVISVNQNVNDCIQKLLQTVYIHTEGKQWTHIYYRAGVEVRNFFVWSLAHQVYHKKTCPWLQQGIKIIQLTLTKRVHRLWVKGSFNDICMWNCDT